MEISNISATHFEPADAGAPSPRPGLERAAAGAHPAADKPVARNEHLAAIALGGLSLALYALLFWFDEELLELAQAAREGDKRFFFVPIGIALLFSFVHGAFTGRFWDVLGLKARS